MPTAGARAHCHAPLRKRPSPKKDLPFVIRRIVLGIVTYLLTVAGFLALFTTTLEATVSADITMNLRTMMDKTDLRGLDRPSVVRVATSFVRLLSFDLGTSRSSKTAGRYGSERVIDLVLEAMPSTLALFVVATALSVAAGFTIGTRMAMRRASSSTGPPSRRRCSS